MKRQIIILTAALLLLPLTYGQDFYQLKAEGDQYYAHIPWPNNRPFNFLDAIQWDDFQLWVADWQGQVFWHVGSLPDAQNVTTQYIRNIQQNGPVTAKTPTIGGPWIEVGPDRNTPTADRGRERFVTIAKQNPNLILAGSAVGGVYYSVNGGLSWKNGGMDTQLPVTSASHCIVHPTNSNVWFCATGDNQAYKNGGRNDIGWNQSFGVYRTVNSGATWDFVGLNNLNWGWEIYKLVFKPNDPNTIYAATSAGVWQTTNALASPASVTWAQLNIDSSRNNADIFDIEFQPGSSTNMYASGEIMVQSNNAGNSWSPMPNTTFLTIKLIRVSMSVTPANPDLVYAVVINTDYASVYRFNVSTQSWTDKGPVCTSSWPCATWSYSPPWGVLPSVAGSMGVSPTNPGLLYIGSIAVARCVNADQSGPCNWVNVQTGAIHVDIGQIRFAPDGATIWAATDGGMFQSTPSNTPWIDRNIGTGLATIDYMAGATVDDSQGRPGAGIFLLGMQDNGDELTLDHGRSWNEILLSDGQQPMIDYQNSANIYVAAQGGYRLRSNTEGASFSYNASTPCGSYTFSVLNSSNPSTFYAASCSDVMRTIDMGVSFTRISNFNLALIWRVYTAPSNPDYLYAWGLDPNSAPHLFKTKNVNAPCTSGLNCPTWVEIPLPGPKYGFPAGLGVDPNNPDEFTLAYAGYSVNTGRVYFYNGNSFTDLDPLFSLPQVTIDALVAEPGSQGYVFASLLAGVYYHKNGMNTWLRWGDDKLPHTHTHSLEINCPAGLLRAGTFGRGLWESSVPCPQ